MRNAAPRPHMDAPDDPTAIRFFETGAVPKLDAPTEDERVAFARECLKARAFKERVWPHLVCFVDASNVARRRQVEVWKVNEPKAKLADLDAVVDALKRLRYVPIVVSDANLFQLMDRSYEFQERYTKYPHSVAERRQADNILFQGLRKLPEAACLTNDRFSKPDEVRDFADVTKVADRFYRHHWDGDTPSFVADDGQPMPGALRRFVRRFG